MSKVKEIDRFVLKTTYHIYEKGLLVYCLAENEQYSGKIFYTLSVNKSKEFIYKGFDKEKCMEMLYEDRKCMQKV